MPHLLFSVIDAYVEIFSHACVGRSQQEMELVISYGGHSPAQSQFFSLGQFCSNVPLLGCVHR
jgi:hypothetical protein